MEEVTFFKKIVVSPQTANRRIALDVTSLRGWLSAELDPDVETVFRRRAISRRALYALRLCV